MPTYEYVCEKCGHEFETFRSISAPPLKTCLKDLCGRKKWAKGRVKKKISAGAGLLFKGSGFYITDYRSEGYKQSAKSAATEGKPAANTESKSDAKPDPKAETKAGFKPESKAEPKPAAKVESKPAKTDKK